MVDLRERVERGTPDFPFAYYKMYRDKDFNRMAPLHWHPEIELIYGISGEAVVNVADEMYVLKPKDILFVNPEELHLIRPNTLPVRYEAAVFSTKLFEFADEHFFNRSFVEPLSRGELRFPHVIEHHNAVYSKIQPIVHNLFYDNINSRPLILSSLLNIFTILQESGELQIGQSSTARYTDELKLCISYIKEHYSERITLSVLASLVHMSPNYFCSRFKALVGITPFEYISDLRIKKASSELVKTNLPVAQIAANCGFESIGFFIRKFRQIKGCTPSEYRKNTVRK